MTRIGGGCVTREKIQDDKTGSPGFEEMSSVGLNPTVVVHLVAKVGYNKLQQQVCFSSLVNQETVGLHVIYLYHQSYDVIFCFALTIMA